MAISDELTRIQTAKADIKSAIEAKGVTVPSSALIDEYDTYIAQISGGSSDLRDLLEKDITSVDIPAGTTKIGSYAFIECTSLASVSIPNSVTRIETNAFNSCSSLTSITIPDSVTFIGNGAFLGCSGLTSVNIPSGITTIAPSVFEGCRSLTDITIPSSVTTISYSALKDCSGLTSITVEATTPPSLGTNVLSNTNNCPIYVPAASVATYQAASGWSDYASRIQAIPSIVTAIFNVWWPGSEPDPVYIFYMGKQSEFTKIEVDGVVLQYIRNDYTFNTKGEHTVKYTLADPTSIGQRTFLNCGEMTSVTIPSSVTSIGNGAFNPCSSLSSVTVLATTPPTLGTDVFNNNASGRKIYVPSASVATYQVASGWSSYAADIEAIPTT